jgi:glycopeptide antibiotics resistance protein
MKRKLYIVFSVFLDILFPFVGLYLLWKLQNETVDLVVCVSALLIGISKIKELREKNKKVSVGLICSFIMFVGAGTLAVMGVVEVLSTHYS